LDDIGDELLLLMGGSPEGYAKPTLTAGSVRKSCAKREWFALGILIVPTQPSILSCPSRENLRNRPRVNPGESDNMREKIAVRYIR